MWRETREVRVYVYIYVYMYTYMYIYNSHRRRIKTHKVINLEFAIMWKETGF